MEYTHRITAIGPFSFYCKSQKYVGHRCAPYSGIDRVSGCGRGDWLCGYLIIENVDQADLGTGMTDNRLAICIYGFQWEPLEPETDWGGWNDDE